MDLRSKDLYVFKVLVFVCIKITYINPMGIGELFLPLTVFSSFTT